MDRARRARSMQKDTGLIFSRYDQADEVNKRFIIWHFAEFSRHEFPAKVSQSPSQHARRFHSRSSFAWKFEPWEQLTTTYAIKTNSFLCQIHFKNYLDKDCDLDRLRRNYCGIFQHFWKRNTDRLCSSRCRIMMEMKLLLFCTSSLVWRVLDEKVNMNTREWWIKHC